MRARYRTRVKLLEMRYCCAVVRGIKGLQEVSKNFLEKRGKNSPFGGVAQVGERCVCNAQVSGSNPLTSIFLVVTSA